MQQVLSKNKGLEGRVKLHGLVSARKVCPARHGQGNAAGWHAVPMQHSHPAECWSWHTLHNPILEQNTGEKKTKRPQVQLDFFFPLCIFYFSQ